MHQLYVQFGCIHYVLFGGIEGFTKINLKKRKAPVTAFLQISACYELIFITNVNDVRQ